LTTRKKERWSVANSQGATKESKTYVPREAAAKGT